MPLKLALSMMTIWSSNLSYRLTSLQRVIEDFLPDSTVRLPDFVVPEGMTATQALVALSIEGLKAKGLDKDEEYVSRLRQELQVIDSRGFSKYFLTMRAIADKAVQKQLVGPGTRVHCGLARILCA